MKRNIILLVILSLCFPLKASAHGGSIAISQRQDPFYVSAALSPSPLRAGQADITVVVREAATNKPFVVDQVRVRLEPESGPLQESVAQPEGQLAQAMYSSHDLHFDHDGTWRITAIVTNDGNEWLFPGTVTVGSPLLQLVSPILCLVPVVVIGALGLVALRRRSKSVAPGVEGTQS